MNKIVGIDIGGTKTSVVLADCGDVPEIVFRDKAVFTTNAELGWSYAIENMYRHIDRMIANKSLKEKDFAIGISCGGPLDANSGIIFSPPNLIGWDNVNITAMMKERYGVSVFLQNDANSCALAEWMNGAGKGYKNVVYLTFGTGLGAGLILNNRLYCGSNGMAGEVGHIRLERMGPTGYGKSGSFEGFCSGNGIRQLAHSVILEKLQSGQKVDFCPDTIGLESITSKRVFDAAKKGDAVALEIVQLVGSYLGQGLSVIIDMLNPEVIILGTIFVHNSDLLYPHLNSVIRKEALQRSVAACSIVPAQLGEELGDYSAVTTAIYGLRYAQS